MIVQRQMQVRPGRVACTSYVPHKLPLPDRRTGSYRQPGQVGINRLPAVRMIHHHAVTKGPHTVHPIGGRPAVLNIADSAGSAGIDRLAIAVCERDIYTIVAGVGVPGVSGERKCKAALGYGAGPAQGICRQRIISKNMVYIVNVAVTAPPMDSCLPDRKLPGIFFGVPAPGQGPGYVAIAEVVALQGKAYMGDIPRTGCSRKL